MLLDARADPNMRDSLQQTALHFVAWIGTVDRTEVFAFVCVVVSPSHSFNKALIGAGADVDAKDEFGRTSLELAIACGNIACAECLLDAGAKLCNLRQPLATPEWFARMVSKRARCMDSCRALYGVLRMRWRTSNGTRVPRDMINVLTRLLWTTRRDVRWDGLSNK